MCSSDLKECERSSICFIGGSGHNPNLNGVTWFLDNVWSLILKENPNFTFKIIGKWDEKIKTEYQKKYRNLFFCGFVDNLAMVISECIMVIPILIGSGIRMKILESVNFYSLALLSLHHLQYFRYRMAEDIHLGSISAISS